MSATRESRVEHYIACVSPLLHIGQLQLPFLLRQLRFDDVVDDVDSLAFLIRFHSCSPAVRGRRTALRAALLSLESLLPYLLDSSVQLLCEVVELVF